MAEISNNLIAGLLIVAIVVSIVGLANTLTLVPVLQYTGYGTSGFGTTNLSVTGEVSLTLMRNESQFGPGYVNSDGGGILYLATNKTNPQGTRNSGTWFYNGSEGNTTDGNCTYGALYYAGSANNCANPFVVENDGNDDTTCIKIYATSSAAEFIGGSAQTPVFEFMGYDNESSWGSSNGAGTGYEAACSGTLTQAWTSIPKGAGSPENVCTELNSTDYSDEIRIHFRLGLPDDTPEGIKTNTVTITASGTC